LRAYQEVTGPILKWYGEQAVRTVDGAAAPEQVSREIERAVMETAGCVKT
jgi:hypothetical protein